MLRNRWMSAGWLVGSVVLFFALSAALAEGRAAEPGFVVLGDMPYGESAQAGSCYRRLIEAINAIRPAFSVHVGDIKSGSTSCADEALLRQRDNFALFAHPLLYTPGDNEWTDCHRASNGGYSPTERLGRLRNLFFEGRRSLGMAPTPGASQSELSPDFAEYVENRIWEQGVLLFVTVHVVGSNNGLASPAPDARLEFEHRERANRAWLELAFRRAAAMDAGGVVLFMQADPFATRSADEDFPAGSGFRGVFAGTLLPLAKAWGRPVLLVHGDEHRLRIDRPFRLSGQPLDNVFRIEVPGDRDMRALHVRWQGDGDPPFVVEAVAPGHAAGSAADVNGTLCGTPPEGPRP